MAIGYRACESSLPSYSPQGFHFFLYKINIPETLWCLCHTLVLLSIWSIYVSSGVSSDVLLSPLVADAL